MTTLHLKHIDETPNSTVSELMLGERHLAYIIEDGYRPVKVPGETRLYARTYELFPRKEGGFFNRYKRSFGHEFVIGFKDAVEFDLVLIHIGNHIGDTRSCLLCNTEYYLDNEGNYRGAGSTDAYLMLYDLFAELFKDGKVFIEIDRGIVPDVPVIDEPEPPTVKPPEEPRPEVVEPQGCLIHPFIIIALLCLGAAIGSL